MNKSDFVDLLSKKLNCSKASTLKTIDAFFECVGEALQKEKDLRFVGFGTFKIQNLPKREVKTPISGKLVTVPARKYVRFSSGEHLKRAVNK